MRERMDPTTMETIPLHDSVNHPRHYTFLQVLCPDCGKNQNIEVIDIIEGADLGFHLGNVVKYILRAPHKGNKRQDLEKAAWYLQREIQNLSA